MKIKAIKMHCQGNDFIFLDLINKTDFCIVWSDFAKKITDRHYGIGGDGLVLIEPKMRIFNTDGSEAETCGSALLCTTLYLCQKYGSSKVIIETIKGKIPCFINESPTLSPSTYLSPASHLNTSGVGQILNKQPISISANMGKVTYEKDIFLKIDKYNLKGNILNIGNPHLVFFENSILDENIDYWEKIENDINFPNRINIENVKIINKHEIEITIWERGCGFTLSCGSGACVSAFISHKLKGLDKKITVRVPGGELLVEVLDDDSCLLTGQVTTVFETELDL